MKTKSLLLALALSLATPILFAQEEINIEKVTVINYGDGRLLFREMDSEKPLQGQRRIIDGYHSSYILAYFKDGMYDGEYKLYQNNALSQEGIYVAGVKNGYFKDYYKDGTTVKTEREVKNGKVHGIVKDYNQQGQLEKEKGYNEGTEHGIDKVYDTKTGKLRRDCNYQNGRQHGHQVEHLISNRGDYTKISNYDNGVLNGEYSETLEEGIVRTKGAYKNGEKDGKWISNNSEGIPTEQITYKEGKKHGEIRKYYTDGEVEEIANYANDKRDGLTKTFYYDTRQPKSEFTYKTGKKEGSYKLFYDDGKLKEEGRCENDREVYRKEYHTNGKLKSIRERTSSSSWTTLEEYNSQGEKL